MSDASPAVLFIAVPAAVIGAASFGLGSAVQQRATKQVPTTRPLDPRLLLELAQQPRWVLGVLAVVVGLSLQLVALAFGPLALVQPLLATGILFAATFAAWLVKRRVDRIIVLGCLLCVTGLSAFLLLARPRVASAAGAGESGIPWVLALILGAVVAVSLAVAAGSPGGSRVIALALATGVLFGANAGLMKVVAGQFRAGGAAELFGHPTVYAVCLIGPMGFLLSQNTFQHGDAIAPALAVIRTVDPVVGVVIGVTWLGEQLAASPAILAGEVIAAIVLVGGIALLAHRAPQLRQPLGEPGQPGAQRLTGPSWA